MTIVKVRSPLSLSFLLHLGDGVNNDDDHSNTRADWMAILSCEMSARRDPLQ